MTKTEEVKEEKYMINGEEGFAGWHGISTWPGAQVTKQEIVETLEDINQSLPEGKEWSIEIEDKYGRIAVISKEVKE